LNTLSLNAKKGYFGLFLAILFILFVVAIDLFFPVGQNAVPGGTMGFGVDWKGFIRPTTLAFIHGKSPYSNGVAIHPPWAYLLMAPVALFPENLGAAIMFALNYFVYGLILLRMKARPLSMLAFLSLPLVLLNGINGNVDWLCLVGVILPQPIGLLFLAIKPQIGAGIAIFWMVEAWRNGGFKQFLFLIAPTSVAYLISFLLYGFWPAVMLTNMVSDPYNASLGPIGVVIGGVMLAQAIHLRKRGLALMSSTFFAPYINIHSFDAAILGLEPNTVEFYAAIGLVWFATFLRLTGHAMF
jgi:hypothetical protein